MENGKGSMVHRGGTIIGKKTVGQDCITDDDLWTPDNTSPEGLAMINFGVAAATFDCADSKGAQRPYEEATR